MFPHSGLSFLDKSASKCGREPIVSACKSHLETFLSITESPRDKDPSVLHLVRLLSTLSFRSIFDLRFRHTKRRLRNQTCNYAKKSDWWFKHSQAFFFYRDSSMTDSLIKQLPATHVNVETTAALYPQYNIRLSSSIYSIYRERRKERDSLNYLHTSASPVRYQKPVLLRTTCYYPHVEERGVGRRYGIVSRRNRYFTSRDVRLPA